MTAIVKPIRNGDDNCCIGIEANLPPDGLCFGCDSGYLQSDKVILMLRMDFGIVGLCSILREYALVCVVAIRCSRIG